MRPQFADAFARRKRYVAQTVAAHTMELIPNSFDVETEAWVDVADAHRPIVQLHTDARLIMLDEHAVSHADYALFALQTDVPKWSARPPTRVHRSSASV